MVPPYFIVFALFNELYLINYNNNTTQYKIIINNIIPHMIFIVIFICMKYYFIYKM